MANSDNESAENTVTRRGLLLKETREAKGLTIETVHELTKIPLDVLHAIEEGYTVRMVSAYYFKGFIKMYAKFLGLDASLVLDEPSSKKSETGKKVFVSVDPEHRKFNEYILRQSKKQLKINLFVSGISIVIFLIGIGLWKNHTGGKESRKPSQSMVDSSANSQKLLNAQAADRKIVEQTKPKAKLNHPSAKKESPLSVNKAEPAPVAKDDVPTAPAKSAVGNKVTLSIKTKAAGWLQVKVDGNLVFQSTLRAGAVESWQADKSIELSGKNVNNLEFEVNGKVLGQLGRSDRGARRVLITKDGLTVKD